MSRTTTAQLFGGPLDGELVRVVIGNPRLKLPNHVGRWNTLVASLAMGVRVPKKHLHPDAVYLLESTDDPTRYVYGGRSEE